MLRLVVLVAIVVTVGGCTRVGAPEQPSTAASPVVSPAPTIALVQSAAPSEQPLPSDLDPDLRHSIDMRRSLGLRFDIAYVLKVAADPRASVSIFDFPTYPEEDAKVFADQAAQAVVGEAIRAYAAKHEDEFGGYYIDREAMPGVVVALWTNDLEVHERAIRSTIARDAPFAVRRVRYAEAELRAIQDRVTADWRARWIATIPAVVQGVGVETIGNYVEVEVSSANPDAASIIEAHYDLGDRLRVESDGTGAALLPWGWIEGRVLRANGSTYRPDEDVTLMWGGPADDPGDCGGGDMGYGVDERGHFKIPCQVGRRTVKVVVMAQGDDWLTVGQGTVVVRKGATSRMTITLSEDPGKVARGEVQPSGGVP